MGVEPEPSAQEARAKPMFQAGYFIKVFKINKGS